MASPPFNQIKRRFAVLLVAASALLLSACVGFDPARSQCRQDGLKEGTAEFRQCLEKTRAYYRYLNMMHRTGGP